jgi:hypothetical protein
MRYIKRIDELRSVDGEAPRGGGDYLVLWSSGRLYIDPKMQRLPAEVQMSFPLGAQVHPGEKLVTLRPMDDWADLKIVRKLQQMLGDMVKAGIIDGSWECEVASGKETKRTLGSKRVRDILAYDASLSERIPIAFHGTTSKNLPGIERFGIAPTKRTGGEGRQNWDRGYAEQSGDVVYMTMDYDRALYYARHACEERGGAPVVIEVRDIPVSMVTVDDDFLNNMGSLRLMWMLKTGKDPAAGGTSYVQGIRMSGQFAVTQRIPPSMFAKIYKEKK